MQGRIAEVILKNFLSLVQEELKGERIVRCDNLAHIPFEDGTRGLFLATAQTPEMGDCDLDLPENQFIDLHLRKLANELVVKLKDYLRACPGCELLVFKLERPGGMEWSEWCSSSQLHIRLVRGFSIEENRKHTRFDVLFGIRAAGHTAAEVAA